MCPTYEYYCTSCKDDFEAEHKMTERIAFCEECGTPLIRHISPSTFVLKGKGWYKDGYGNNPPSSSNK